jgi:hypothetical protein
MNTGTQDQSIGDLLRRAQELAREQYDGHLTMLRFTGGWKVMLGTPDLRSGDGSGEVSRLRSFGSLEEALSDLLRGSEEGAR